MCAQSIVTLTKETVELETFPANQGESTNKNENHIFSELHFNTSYLQDKNLVIEAKKIRVLSVSSSRATESNMNESPFI